MKWTMKIRHVKIVYLRLPLLTQTSVNKFAIDIDLKQKENAVIRFRLRRICLHLSKKGKQKRLSKKVAVA